MAAPKEIQQLVEKFKSNYNFYQSSEYNEEDLRHDFLNPFFKALGWDMEDERGLGPRRDIRYERRIRSGAPDFGFYIDSKRQFFVEAKKPSVNVCDNPIAAFQLRSYGWSAKIPRSILTDFEELSIYDCTIRPKAGDNAKIARLECIACEQYIERWDEIAGLFSKDAVVSGSLEKLEKKHTKQAVDDDFLEDISRWREILAKNIALRNEKLSEEQINKAVQNILDRIIFLRIAEDRKVESANRLQELSEKSELYASLLKVFKMADKRYDSGLFRMDLEEDIGVDDEALKTIISELYFPKSPYKFDAISADILGQVYEQFLGKVIRLTEGHHAKVEDKPEIRKAGGVYYTPVYIVEYIVKNTVGKLLEGKAPKEITTLSVLDPACGSGSFLIGAYQYLMDWYRDYYVNHDVSKHEKKKLVYKDNEGLWQLTLAERKRVLTTHIYGVDIDRQAVEVARLSLLLKALEAPEQQSLFNERLLPELDQNIKCGNSLIGTDYFSGQLTSDPIEVARINAFDWEAEFSEIFKRGGFDAVIGNPPYVSFGLRDAEKMPPAIKEYYKRKYSNSAEYKISLYAVFMERAISLTKQEGFHSFIVPDSFLLGRYFSKIRSYILKNGHIHKFLLFNYGVFEATVGFSVVYFFQKVKNLNPEHDLSVVLVKSPDELIYNKASTLTYQQSYFNTTKHNRFRLFFDAKTKDLISKIDHQSVELGSVYTGRTGVRSKIGQKNIIFKKKIKDSYQKGIISGGQIKRYGIIYEDDYINIDPVLLNSGGWDYKVIHNPKILLRQTGDSLIGAIDTDGYYHLNNIHSFAPKGGVDLELEYILGILNSKLMNFYYQITTLEVGRAMAQTDIETIESLPVHLPDKDVRKLVVGLVQKITALNQQIVLAQGEDQRVALQRQIDAIDRQIDQLVYKLYGLTSEEIKIVEDSNNK